MHTQKKIIILIISCFLFVVCGIVFVLKKQKGNSLQNSNRSVPSVIASKKETPTVASYEAGVQKALTSFVSLRKTLPDFSDASRVEKESMVVRVAHDAIVDLIVPSVFRDKHLALILSLTQIEQGILDKNVALWQQGETAFDSFLKNNSWAQEK